MAGERAGLLGPGDPLGDRPRHDKRPGRADDVAETAFFLASPGARHITAQVIHVNGGAYVTR